MNLRYITMSDPRDDISVDDAITLLDTCSPCGKWAVRPELAIQAHNTRVAYGMPRYNHISELIRTVRENRLHLNLAIHVNLVWRDMFCAGKFAPEIAEWFYAQHINGEPIFRRWQININGGDFQFNVPAIAKIIANYPDREFIFQYASKNRARINRLNKTGVPFSLLYDASGGRGIMATNYRAPIFENHSMGYSGGLAYDNVYDALTQISHVAPNRNDIWIDAEGKLKNPNTKKFDLSRALAYFANARYWLSENAK